MTLTKNNRIWISILLMLAMCSLVLVQISGALAQSQKQQKAVLPSLDSVVRYGKLPNGLTYYIRSNVEPKNRAELYLVNRFGSLQETDDQQGLAHFVEHMAFNGTKDFPKNTLVDFLQKAGVRFGADLNAMTSFDQTIYQLPLPTDDPALFDKGLDILLNWAGHIVMEGKEVDAERGIILEEERLRGKNMGERMHKQTFPVLAAGSRYEKRLPIGKEEILKSFPYSVIQKYYTNWYRPNMQAVIAVGDFDADAVEASIKQKFSQLKNPAGAPKLESYGIPDNRTPLVKVVTDPENPNTVASWFYKLPKNTIKDVGSYRRTLVNSLINQMINARLEEVRQSGTAAFLGADAQVGGFLGNKDAFQVSVQASDAAHLESAVAAVYAETVRMKKFGFTDGELERAKKGLMSGIERSYKERSKRASIGYVNEYTRHFLEGEIAPGIEVEYKLYQDVVPQITTMEVNQIAAGLLTDSNRIVILEANEKDKAVLPNEKTLLAWVSGDRSLQAYKDEAVDAKLIGELPKAGSIVSEKKIPTWEATEVTLSNGLKVIIKPTDFKADQILFTAFSPGGLAAGDASEVSTYRSAQYSSAIVLQSGLGSFSGVVLDKMLAGKSVSVGPYINNYEEGVNGFSTPEDLETALQLVNLYFTSPRKDTTAFNTIIKQLQTVVATRYDNPVAAYQDTVSSVLNNRNFRSKPMSETLIKTLNLNKALDFYSHRFANAADFTFVFVGNIDRAKLDPLLCTYLASLPSKAGVEVVKDLGLHPTSGKITQKVYRGLEDKVMVSMNFHGMYVFSEEENLMLDGLKSVLNNKLTERLREKESGVYSPSVSVREEKIPVPQYRIGVSFTCSTANVDKLIAAVYEEIDGLKAKGVTPEDLVKFKAEEERQLELKVRQNDFWLAFMKGVYKGEQREHKLQLYGPMLHGLTQEKLQSAARKYFDYDNVATVILLPENSSR